MTKFLIVSDDDLELLAYAVMRTVREHRQAMAAIMSEREARRIAGVQNVERWEGPRFDRLLQRVDRLQQVGERLDTVPDTTNAAKF